MSDSEAIVNPAAVAESDHDDDEFAVADLADDAVVPDADAQQAAVALKGFGTAGPRLGGQGGHGVDQAALDWPVDPAQGALSRRTQDDLKRVGPLSGVIGILTSGPPKRAQGAVLGRRSSSRIWSRVMFSPTSA